MIDEWRCKRPITFLTRREVCLGTNDVCVSERSAITLGEAFQGAIKPFDSSLGDDFQASFEGMLLLWSGNALAGVSLHFWLRRTDQGESHWELSLSPGENVGVLLQRCHAARGVAWQQRAADDEGRAASTPALLRFDERV